METQPQRNFETVAVLAGVGAFLPEQVVSNLDLTRQLDTTDEWITSRVGIHERRRAAPGQATSDLAVAAGARAISMARLNGAESIDTVIVATTTPDKLCPATAPSVATRLGLEGAAAFDVAAVCTGFVYALSVGAGLIAAGTSRGVLVIGADVYSTIINPQDRSTAVIFGDGAGAVVLRPGGHHETGALGPAVLGSDGEHRDLIQIPAGGSSQRSTSHPPTTEDQYFTMAGPTVFRHAVARMSEVSRQALDAAGWDVSDVDRFVAHQANARILDAVTKKIGLPHERQLSNIATVGNTGAASIPILLAEAVTNRGVAPGDRLLMTAFGGGLTWGAITLRWPDLALHAMNSAA